MERIKFKNASWRGRSSKSELGRQTISIRPKASGGGSRRCRLFIKKKWRARLHQKERNARDQRVRNAREERKESRDLIVYN